PKGNGISPEGWQGKTTTRRSHHNFALPLCRKLLVGGAVGVRLTFATFLFFFGNGFIMPLTAKYCH
ncbi:MAG: hypothetical protein LRY59_01540, partial [Bacteroides graminisolvens]|nr:hypothetical protein [Bacteroides graminisolvens]